jgi:SAM-dependent methyltransferase
MGAQIIGLHEFFETPHGRYLREWEQAQLDRVVADIFGFHALQLGMPDIDALQANRMPHRWLASNGLAVPAAGTPELLPSSDESGPGQGARPLGGRAATDLLCDFAALPFPANSLDLIVLPHTLELDPDPHATLREVERVLVPEGRVVLCGVNPVSLWGLRQRRAHLYRRMGFGQLYLPREGEFIGYWRLRDWLRLLSFEVESGRFGCYRPAVVGERWLERFSWMDRAGSRWWPIFGAVYMIVAVKRVRGMRLLGRAWKSAASRPVATVPLANRRPAASQPHAETMRSTPR